MPATLADIQNKYGSEVEVLLKDLMFEPFMEKEFGYLGVVLRNKETDKILCNLCGKWFTSVSMHVNQGHNITSREYKDEFGIYYNVGLVSRKTSERLSNAILMSPERMNNLTLRGVSRVEPDHKQAVSHKKAQFKNKMNSCDAQILQRYTNLAKVLGKKPNSTDIAREQPLLRNLISSRYKTFKDFLKSNKLERPDYKYNQNYSVLNLIDYMQKLALSLGKVPSLTDVRKSKGPDYSTFQSYFGSWSKAKIMAGLDQLLYETKGGTLEG